MSAETDRLRQLYLDVAGDATVTERQEAERSHDPIEEDVGQAVTNLAREHGLDDALEGVES